MARKKRGEAGAADGGEEDRDAAADNGSAATPGGSGGKNGRKGGVGGEGLAEQRTAQQHTPESAIGEKADQDGEGKRRRRKKGRGGIGGKEDEDAKAQAPVAGLVFSKDGKCVLATWLNKVQIPTQSRQPFSAGICFLAVSG